LNIVVNRKTISVTELARARVLHETTLCIPLNYEMPAWRCSSRTVAWNFSCTSARPHLVRHGTPALRSPLALTTLTRQWWLRLGGRIRDQGARRPALGRAPVSAARCGWACVLFGGAAAEVGLDSRARSSRTTRPLEPGVSIRPARWSAPGYSTTGSYYGGLLEHRVRGCCDEGVERCEDRGSVL
jgi:hypothetical protein